MRLALCVLLIYIDNRDIWFWSNHRHWKWSNWSLGFCVSLCVCMCDALNLVDSSEWMNKWSNDTKIKMKKKNRQKLTYCPTTIRYQMYMQIYKYKCVYMCAMCTKRQSQCNRNSRMNKCKELENRSLNSNNILKLNAKRNSKIKFLNIFWSKHVSYWCWWWWSSSVDRIMIIRIIISIKCEKNIIRLREWVILSMTIIISIYLAHINYKYNWLVGGSYILLFI